MICKCEKPSRTFRPILASQVLPSDLLRTRSAVHRVTDVEHGIVDTDIVEVQLVDSRGSFFIGGPGTAPEFFIEVCGALAAVHDDEVVLLRFRRFDRFRQIIVQNPELALCRDQLETLGFSSDLANYGFKYGNLLVQPDLAWQTINALFWGRFELRSSDIVVSQELKAIVLEEVLKHAPRANPVMDEVTIQLAPEINNRKTFVDMREPSPSSNVTAHSSTDAHLGLEASP